MNDVATEFNTHSIGDLQADGARWKQRAAAVHRNRFRIVLVASCLLAVLFAIFLALSTLISPIPNTVLVSLYLLPPANETLGVCAPYHPIAGRLFNLMPSNLEIVPDSLPQNVVTTNDATVVSLSESNGGFEVDTNKPSSQTNQLDFRITDWQRAVKACSDSDQLVVYVSSFARTEHDQVVFFGRAGEKQSRVSLVELLSMIEHSGLTKSFVVLDVFWPMASDNGNSRERLDQLAKAIRNQFSRFAPKGCQVLFTNSEIDASAVLGSESQSMLCKLLNAAVSSPDCDLDGRTSIREIVQRLSEAGKSRRDDGNGPSLTLLGDGTEFCILQQPLKRCPERIYPDSLSQSWELRKHYLRSIETPYLHEIARKWEAGLSDLESRWRRGEPVKNINIDTLRLKNEVLQEILQAIEIRCFNRSDSVSIASHCFPLNKCKEARQKAVDLVNGQNDNFSDGDLTTRGAKTRAIVARYVETFLPHDAPLALKAVLETIEQTTSIDEAQWDLVLKVCDALPCLNQYPVVVEILKMSTDDLSFDQIGDRLRMFLLEDQLGLNRESEVILSKAIAAARTDFSNAKKLCSSAGMVSDEVKGRFVVRTISAAEAVVAAERNVSLSLRLVQTVLLELSIDNSFGLCHNSSQDCSELIAAADRVIDLLERIKVESVSNGTLPSTELAFLRQACESVDRLIARRASSSERSFRIDPMSASSVVSAFVAPHDRGPLITEGSGSIDIRTVSLGPQSAQVFSSSSFRDSRSIDRSLADLGDRISRLVDSSDAIDLADGIDRRHELSVVVSGNLEQLSWDMPEAFIELSVNPRTSSRTPIKFQFLDPASRTLTVHPAYGELVVGKPQRIQITLRKTQGDPDVCDINGLWLKAESSLGESLTAIPMKRQKSQPIVDIDFGDGSISQGRDIKIRLWPDSRPQSLEWHLTSASPLNTNVVVTVKSENGISVVSEPLAIYHDRPTLISFPPGQTEPENTTNSFLQCPLTVLVSDSKNNEVLGQWVVTADVRDPRGLMRPGLAEFIVESDGSNRLAVNIQRLRAEGREPVDNEFAPRVRLELESDKTSSLLDFGNSKLQATVGNGPSATVLFAENLRFVEGGPAFQSIPISINGDNGYFELLGRFPRRSGTVKLSWDQQPRLRVRASTATTSATGLMTTIEARNLCDSDAIILEVLSGAENASERHWESRFDTSRQIECLFGAAGAGATFTVNASRRDWSLLIPSDFGTGEYRLRVSTAKRIGDSSSIAEHRFLIDDGVPKNIHARADVAVDQTTLHIGCIPSPSGNSSLGIKTVAITTDDKIVSLIAQSTDEAGARWQVNWPATVPMPSQIELSFVTGAGKVFTSTCDLQTRRIVPVAKVSGKVFEGSIAQPQLAVKLRNMNGAEVAKVLTDGQGQFQFSIPPGEYQLFSNKTATQRSALSNISVVHGDAKTVDLNLQRLPPSGT